MFTNYKETYLTFENRTNLHAMEKVLIAHSIDFKIKPAPRSLCKSCVAAILIDFDILNEVEEILYAYPNINVKEFISVEKKRFKLFKD